MVKILMHRFSWVLIIGLVFFVGVNSGCESLHRKFTRKKKVGISEAQSAVILDPIDYPDKVKSATEIYKQQYSLWKVWQSDLPNVIMENANEKKVRYVLGQMKEQLLAMQALLKEELRPQMDPYLKEIDSLFLEFEKSPAFRNKDDILSRIQRLGRDVRNRFSPDKITDSLASL